MYNKKEYKMYIKSLLSFFSQVLLKKKNKSLIKEKKKKKRITRQLVFIKAKFKQEKKKWFQNAYLCLFEANHFYFDIQGHMWI